DPRFTRSAAVADYYAPLRAGSDIAFLGGVINYLLTNDKIQHEYVKAYTDVSFIVRADYMFEDGLFSGYNEAKRKYDKETWMYELGWTQHSVGSQMIRTAAMVQLLLGNIGMVGGGLNALRGHSNIQGLTDLGLLSELLPGYLSLPGEKETDYKAYIEKRVQKP